MPKAKSRTVPSQFTTKFHGLVGSRHTTRTTDRSKPRSITGNCGNLSDDRHAVETSKTRDGLIQKFMQVLLDKTTKEEQDSGAREKAEQLATKIESHMYSQHNEIDDAYRTNFRRLWVSLKDRNTEFASKLMSGELKPEDFASSSVEELKSDYRRKSDADTKLEAIRRCTISEVLPEDIVAVKDGRETQKWGMGRSAASID